MTFFYRFPQRQTQRPIAGLKIAEFPRAACQKQVDKIAHQHDINPRHGAGGACLRLNPARCLHLDHGIDNA